jgi:hypothetical protein
LPQGFATSTSQQSHFGLLQERFVPVVEGSMKKAMLLLARWQ